MEMKYIIYMHKSYTVRFIMLCWKTLLSDQWLQFTMVLQSITIVQKHGFPSIQQYFLPLIVRPERLTLPERSH